MKETSRQFAVVNGIAIGEESKGNTVQKMVRELDAHTVWRSGGWQGGHHVEHDDGREMAFSFFGAGTFDGAHTYLKHMVISPFELFEEAVELEEKGVSNPFGLITIDQDCLTTTPFHSAISRTREILRGSEKKGTVGKGVGEAIKDSAHPDYAIRAGELSNRPSVRRKVDNIRRLKLSQAQTLLAKHQGPIPNAVYPELAILQDESLVIDTADACNYLADLIPIVDDEYLEKLLKRDGAIVNEVSHGALHHPWYGFVPHVTQIDPTSQDVMETIRSHNYEGQLIRLGIVRSYITRHGAGPFVTFNPEFSQSLNETHNDVATDWLGEFKSGTFDTVALQYSLAISGGKETFDGLFVSYLDIVSKRNEWPVCEGYEYQGFAPDLEKYFYLDEKKKIVGIKIHPNTRDAAHYAHQVRLTQLLNECKPIITVLRPTETQSLEDVFLRYVENKLGVPVVGTAYGPRVKDRYFRSGWNDVLAKSK
jgi:adenylosuccinate synthase